MRFVIASKKVQDLSSLQNDPLEVFKRMLHLNLPLKIKKLAEKKFQIFAT